MRSAASGGLALLFLAGGWLTVPPRSAVAQEADPWFGRDKLLHFGVSAGLAAGGYGVSSILLEPRELRLAVGGGFALTLGIAKELYDLAGEGDASWRDLTWDVVGTAVGLGVALLVDLAVAALTEPSPSSMGP